MKNLILFLSLFPLLVQAQVDRQLTFHIASDSIEWDSLHFSYNGADELSKVGIADSIVLNYEGLEVDHIYLRLYSQNESVGYFEGHVSGDTIQFHTNITEEGLAIDTIVGDQFYYETIAFHDHFDTHFDAGTLDSFLLAQLEDNYNNLYGSYILFVQLQLFGEDRAALQTVKTLLEKQEAKMREHPYYQSRLTTLNSLLARDKVEYTTFSLLDREGKQTNIKPSAKEYILLDFWFLRCPPCIEQHQTILEDFAENRFPKNVEFIGMNVGDSPEELSSYLQKHNIPWQNYIDASSNYSTQLGITAFPTYLLIDQKGEVISSSVSYEAILQKVPSKD